MNNPAELREEAILDAGLRVYSAAVQEASQISGSEMTMADALRLERAALARAIEFVDMRLASEKRG
jgi:hypothetical protein